MNWIEQEAEGEDDSESETDERNKNKVLFVGLSSTFINIFQRRGGSCTS